MYLNNNWKVNKKLINIKKKINTITYKIKIFNSNFTKKKRKRKFFFKTYKLLKKLKILI